MRVPSEFTPALSSDARITRGYADSQSHSAKSWWGFPPRKRDSSHIIRQVFEDIEALAGKKVMQGNTDTIQYWNLTRNIYRFSPAREGTRFGVHTVDEDIDMMAHLRV